MSRTWKRVDTTENVVDTITCNVCNRVFTVGEDDAEIQEIISIVKTFGYHSEYFGDQTIINVDICEECGHKMFGHMTEAIHNYHAPWVYVEPEEEDLTIEIPDGTITFRR